jgi:hypothetical protein
MSGLRTVTVKQRPRWGIWAGLGIVVFALGLAVSLGAQPTVSGKISAAVLFGLLIALIVWLWLRDHGVTVGPRLALVGSGQVITIYGFSANALRRECTAAGWRVGHGSPEQSAQDLPDL